jgi:hypothetical protein
MLSFRWGLLVYASARECYFMDMKASSHKPEIVTRDGKPVSVKDYEELLERAEDAEDIAWLRRARRKKLNYRPVEDYLAERRRK